MTNQAPAVKFSDVAGYRRDLTMIVCPSCASTFGWSGETVTVDDGTTCDVEHCSDIVRNGEWIPNPGDQLTFDI